MPSYYTVALVCMIIEGSAHHLLLFWRTAVSFLIATIPESLRAPPPNSIKNGRLFQVRDGLRHRHHRPRRLLRPPGHVLLGQGPSKGLRTWRPRLIPRIIASPSSADILMTLDYELSL